MATIEDVIEAAINLGTAAADRDEARNVERTAEDVAANTALESLFDGADDLNTPEGRTTINLAFRLAYAGHLG